MQYIILIGDESFTLDSIKSIDHYESINCYSVSAIEGRYCVDFGKDHIFYDFTNSIIDEYGVDEIRKIPFKTPHFIMMVFQSEERMKRVMQQDNFPNDVYIDNDDGLIVSVADYVQMGMPIKR